MGDLVEKVAKLFCLCDAGGDPHYAEIAWNDDPSAFDEDARAAIAVVLREMAEFEMVEFNAPGRSRMFARENGIDLEGKPEGA